MKMIAECAEKLAHLGEKLFNETEMKYRAGDCNMKREEYYIREAQDYAQCGDELTEEALAFVAGMATADRKWYDMGKRLPIPTDGDDFLVKIDSEVYEDRYAYAWYAYDRQCFVCYATGTSLGTAVRYYKPIQAPKDK